MPRIVIIKNKCHVVIHEFSEKNEFIISDDENIFYWRPFLRNIGFEYTDIQDAYKIVEDINTKRYRSERVKKDLLNHWSFVIQIMRDNIIDKVLEPEREKDYNTLYLAC